VYPHECHRRNSDEVLGDWHCWRRGFSGRYLRDQQQLAVAASLKQAGALAPIGLGRYSEDLRD
jgi:hypothetical protein